MRNVEFSTISLFSGTKPLIGAEVVEIVIAKYFNKICDF